MGVFWNAAVPDAEAIRETAQLKRYTDLIMCDSCFRAAALENPEAAARNAGLCISREDARYYARFPLPEPRGLLAAYAKEKDQRRQQIREQAGRLRPAGFAAWRLRQVRRCDLELGLRVNREFTHIPLIIELSSGCSVGCPFCGLSAKRLSRVCRSDEQTLGLFSTLLSGALDLLGPAVREAVLYSATEPLDAPEYPVFAETFREICGKTPIMTTATPVRDPEKTRKVLAMDQGAEKTVHRFSLLSEDIFRRCAESFSPEETLYLDFLPRYTESRIGLVRAGRGLHAEGWDDLTTDQGTIACASGFIINLAEKNIRLTTPCRARDQWPDGEMITEPAFFTTAGEALEQIGKICAQMRSVPEEHLDLMLQPFLRANEKPSFVLENQGIIRFSPDEESTAVCRMLSEKPASMEEILSALSFPPWKTQLTVVSLFRQGIITHMDGFDR